MNMKTVKSEPFFGKFHPGVIPSQLETHEIIRDFDYEKYGRLELLMSGAFGSAKSIYAAWRAIYHCLNNRGARCCLGRRALPDLKKTIYNEVISLLENDPQMVEGVDYIKRDTSAYIKFLYSGSEIISSTWADGRYSKGRSLLLSMLVFEEATENSLKDMAAYKTLISRTQRIPHVKENIVLVCTNPDDDTHWLYEYFGIDDCKEVPENRKVVYSITSDNPFLPKTYIQNIIESHTPAEIERYVNGRWVSIKGNTLYCEYDPRLNYRDYSYEINPKYPIIITFDFNIGVSKPFSVAICQYIKGLDEFHIFEQCVMDTARTNEVMESMYERKLITADYHYIICADAAGSHRDTRSKQTDISIIKEYMDKYEVYYEMRVPRSNPPLRKRHNKVNSYCCNGEKRRRLFVYKDAPMAHKGMRLTRLKESGEMKEVEDEWQHITTAIGYMCVTMTKEVRETKSTLL